MGRIALALLLLVMATAQLSDVSGFVEVLSDYDLGSAVPLWGLAIVFVLGEVVAGVLLLRRGMSARRSGAAVALVVAIAWSALALSAFARGETVQNCGCFGVHLAQPLRWWVLLEDVEFVALAAWVVVRQRGSHRREGIAIAPGFPRKTVKGEPVVRSPQAR